MAVLRPLNSAVSAHSAPLASQLPASEMRRWPGGCRPCTACSRAR